MGGKSCLLSQVGIIVVLAQIGSFVPATKATLSIFKSIFIRYKITKSHPSKCLALKVNVSSISLEWDCMMKYMPEGAHFLSK